MRTLSLCLRSLLKLLGKSDRKVAAVFAFAGPSAHAVVSYIHKGAPDVPIWLFSTVRPLPETAALCERVYEQPSSVILLLDAQRRLWKRWVAISAATWTGDHGNWLMKVAPLLVPPFRALLRNEHGDFFRGTPGAILVHHTRRLRDLVHSTWHRALDIARACWLLVSYHIWRSGPCTRTKDVLRGLARLAAARFLLWCCYPGRKLFGLVHGDAPLELPSVPADGDGLVRYVEERSEFDASNLAALAGSSDARWIVWQQRGDCAPVDDMLTLFDDERTFAVSRQTHVRGWKPTLFPMAPFRVLQPGEASQVLAPISDTIVVDRRKLLALGVPDRGPAGTAWMLLFWKAAAAGWRSYSVGLSGALGYQPDRPAEEAAFIFRVLANPALRRLGPREPDLARGSIAFVPLGGWRHGEARGV
jgi:hypothetical protein